MKSDSLTRAFALLLKRDLTLAARHRAEMINPLLFFVLVTSLFPLGVGADPNMLQAIGPGIIWVAALLAALLSLDGIFRSDFEDGTLEQLLLSSHPVSVLVLAKVLAHWLITGLPLVMASTRVEALRLRRCGFSEPGAPGARSALFLARWMTFSEESVAFID